MHHCAPAKLVTWPSALQENCEEKKQSARQCGNVVVRGNLDGSMTTGIRSYSTEGGVLMIVSKEMPGIASKERKAKMVLHLQSLQALLWRLGFVGVLDMDAGHVHTCSIFSRLRQEMDVRDLSGICFGLDVQVKR